MTRLLVIAALLCSIATPAFAQWKIVKINDRITGNEEHAARLRAKAPVNGVTATLEITCSRLFGTRLPALILSRPVAQGEFGVTVILDGAPFRRLTRSYVDPGHFALFEPSASDMARASRLAIHIHPRGEPVTAFDFDVRGFAAVNKSITC
jgi:hypothetical protein